VFNASPDDFVLYCCNCGATGHTHSVRYWLRCFPRLLANSISMLMLLLKTCPEPSFETCMRLHREECRKRLESLKLNATRRIVPLQPVPIAVPTETLGTDVVDDVIDSHS
jgi:hypothetical protein